MRAGWEVPVEAPTRQMRTRHYWPRPRCHPPAQWAAARTAEVAGSLVVVTLAEDWVAGMFSATVEVGAVRGVEEMA